MKSRMPTTAKMPITGPTPSPAARRASMSHEMNTLVIVPKPKFITMKKTPIQMALDSTEFHRHAETTDQICPAPWVSQSRRRTVRGARGGATCASPPLSQRKTRTRCFTRARAIQMPKGSQPPKNMAALAQSLMKLCCTFLMRGMLRKRLESISQPTALATRTAMSTSPAMAKRSTVFARLELAPDTAACTYMAATMSMAHRANMRTITCSVLYRLGVTDSASM
mmetsp:Transcript_14220/g.41818  ORF Transcript_14220/g.41818 Transcript_14220/m.41818 type:complete len:224 (-) Transcript_14220:362-1033(-)